ncbi:hypothetical protein BV898_15220 [Hypsibius exemplaris]|uniref:Neuroendocrine protein 7B2 n=1 Tax=Hypsibius exemplaris TaxID=2072580 RepID=A0A9X6NHF4_HYPEX|nr:hypothetical protein BV898_15220 [Hypsibius exemplaris]
MFLPIILVSLLAAVSVRCDDLHKVQDILSQIVGHYYSGDGDRSNGEQLVRMDDNELLPTSEDGDIMIPQSVLRDEEHLPFNPLWGHQFVSGGAGEGNQFLRPEGSIPNPHQVKTDSMLPAYCDPPNPCPEGYTASDGCVESVPNTAEFSRDYQSQQNCPCDPEHMFDCAMTSSNAINNIPIDGAHATVRGKKFSEKKSFNGYVESLNARHPRSAGDEQSRQQREKESVNPYLQGQKLPVVAKKAPYHSKDPHV